MNINKLHTQHSKQTNAVGQASELLYALNSCLPNLWSP